MVVREILHLKGSSFRSPLSLFSPFHPLFPPAISLVATGTRVGRINSRGVSGAANAAPIHIEITRKFRMGREFLERE